MNLPEFPFSRALAIFEAELALYLCHCFLTFSHTLTLGFHLAQ